MKNDLMLKPEEDFLVWDSMQKTEPAANWPRYSDLSSVDTIVVKLGTKVVTHQDPAVMDFQMRAIAQDLTDLRQQGYNVLLVSSGACGLGRKIRKQRGYKIPECRTRAEIAEQQQLDAAYGEPELYRRWVQAFGEQPTIEYLLVHNDVKNEKTWEQILKILHAVLADGTIPLINEDDKKSMEEIWNPDGDYFSDNDELSSLVAQHINGKTLLVMLSNVSGIYTQDSYGSYHPEVIRVVKNHEGLVSQAHEPDKDKPRETRGWIESKIKACSDAAAREVVSVVASGDYFGVLYSNGQRTYRPVHAILEGRLIGTRFMPGS